MELTGTIEVGSRHSSKRRVEETEEGKGIQRSRKVGLAGESPGPNDCKPPLMTLGRLDRNQNNR